MKLNKKLVLLFLFTILVVSIFFRLWQFGSIPQDVYWDEIAIQLDSKVIAQTGKDIHGKNWLQPLFLSYGDYKLPAYIWLSSFFTFIFGSHPWVTRLPSLLAGLGSVCIVTWLLIELSNLTKLFPKKHTLLVGLSAAMIVSTSVWSFVFSRTGFESHLGQFFLSVSVLSLVKLRNSKYWLIPAILSAILSVYSYYSVRFVFPVVALLVAGFVMLHLKKKKRIKYLLLVVAIIITFLVSLIPMQRSEYYQASQQFRLSTNSVLNDEKRVHYANELIKNSGNTLVSRVMFHRKILFLQDLATNFVQHLDLNYLFLTGDQNLRHGTQKHGLFLFALLPIFIIGLCRLYYRNKLLLLLLLGWWLSGLIPASVPNEVPHALRSLNSLTPLALLISVGLIELLLWSINGSKKRSLVFVAFAFLFIFNVAQFYHYYFSVYSLRSASSWQDPYTELALEADRYQEANVVIRNFDERFFLWILAYGTYTPEEIQAVMHTKTIPTKIYNIKIVSDLTQKLPLNTVLIGLESDIEEYKQATDSEVKMLHNIKDGNNEKTYLSVEIVE